MEKRKKEKGNTALRLENERRSEGTERRNIFTREDGEVVIFFNQNARQTLPIDERLDCISQHFGDFRRAGEGNLHRLTVSGRIHFRAFELLNKRCFQTGHHARLPVH